MHNSIGEFMADPSSPSGARIQGMLCPRVVALAALMASGGAALAQQGNVRPLNPQWEASRRQYEERERIAKENGTYFLPWIWNSRAHCPRQSVFSGDELSMKQRSVRPLKIAASLRSLSLFVHDRPGAGITKDGVRVELICNYGFFEQVLEYEGTCTFVKSIEDVLYVSDAIPKPRFGRLLTCALDSRSYDDCEVRCDPPAP